MVWDSILLTQGPIVTYQAFKHGKRTSRSIAEQEYTTATESLQQDGFGRIVAFRIPRARGACKVFVKSKPNPWPTSMNVNSNDYDSAIAKAIHNDITAPMKAYLQRNNFITE